MAQLMMRVVLKFNVNGSDGSSFGIEPRHLDYNPCRFRSIQVNSGDQVRPSSTRVYSSSRINKSLMAEDEDYDDDEDDDDDDDDDYDYISDSEIHDDLACFRGLVLDISYRPVNVVCWKRAICLEFGEKADVLEYYDRTVNSPTGSYYIPAVLRVPHLLQVVKRRRIRNGLSRKSLLQRDNYTCQYCSSTENMTIDHVLPIARGGEWKWENLVAACAKCNQYKGPKTLEETNMKLLKIPKAPKDYDIVAIPLTSEAIRMLRTRKGMPEEWRQYLAKPI